MATLRKRRVVILATRGKEQRRFLADRGVHSRERRSDGTWGPWYDFGDWVREVGAQEKARQLAESGWTILSVDGVVR
jgi:hypothetical protein